MTRRPSRSTRTDTLFPHPSLFRSAPAATRRPTAQFDNYKLSEDGHTDKGGGPAFNLIVAKRTSDEATASGLLALGYNLGNADPADGWFRVELEGGRREIVGGSMGDGGRASGRDRVGPYGEISVVAGSIK